MPRITKRFVDSVASNGSDSIFWDDDLKGFGLRVRVSGEKYYLFKYRAGSGRGAPQRKPTIGRHGNITPEEARAIAKGWAAEVARGGDPAGQKEAERQAPTMQQLAQRYLEQHARPHKKAKSIEEDERHLDHYVLPAMGNKKAQHITRKHVTDLHHSLRSKPVTANRVLALLSKMFSLAEIWGLRPQHSNPCLGIKRYAEKRRERFLSEQELTRLGSVLARHEQAGTTYPSALLAIRLLLFSGCRMSEILTLTWPEVDLPNSCLRLKDSKTGAKVVHLPPAAVQLLANANRIESNPHVITGRKAGGHLTDLEKPWQRLRKEAGLDDVRLHDLRHTFASVGAAAGFSLPVIGALLGHTQASTTQRYAHLQADPLKEANSRIASRIAEALAGNLTADTVGVVIPIR